MKTLLLTLALCLGFSTANASGKLSLQNNFYQVQDGKGHEWKPTIGLSIYEFLIKKKVAYSSWTGWGAQAFELSEDVSWFTTKQQLDFFVGPFVIAPGIQYSYIPTFNDHRMTPFLKADYRLW